MGVISVLTDKDNADFAAAVSTAGDNNGGGDGNGFRDCDKTLPGFIFAGELFVIGAF